MMYLCPQSIVPLYPDRLIFLVLEAGIDVDITTLTLIGARGFIIAIVGSVLPIVIGMVISFALQYDVRTSIAAGAAFGPTSLGICVNILKQGKLVNTPVGQLIISAAVIDDMIALIILSQLEVLDPSAEVSVAKLVIPIASALLFLGLGGYIAITWAPPIFETLIFSRISDKSRPTAELIVMFSLLLALMPATYYSRASFLMGAFIAGLSFCRSHSLHNAFVRQFKRVLQWLLRIFFAASIGFQVPVRTFGNGRVIWQGLVFTLALSGKIAVGFMVPNFNKSPRFTDVHLRDCLITGFSMAAEGEFAFVIAVFAVDSGIITTELYASIVLAVLLSTIFPPFLLRYTISYYARMAEKMVVKAAEEQFDTDSASGDKEAQLREGIKNETTVFLCIQTQSDSSWGLLPKLMATMQRLGVEVIDHRSWHPRGIDTTLVNEVFVRDTIKAKEDGGAQTLDDRMNEISSQLENTINQPLAQVKVSRWFPGVLEEIKEEIEEHTSNRRTESHVKVTQAILAEAENELEKTRLMQTNATREKSVGEILAETQAALGNVDGPQAALEAGLASTGPTFHHDQSAPAAAFGGRQVAQRRPSRRVRQKMRSTPVVGGGLFEDPKTAEHRPAPSMRALAAQADNNASPRHHRSSIRDSIAHLAIPEPAGEVAEVVVNGEVFQVRLTPATISRIRSGYSGEIVGDNDIKVSQADVPVEYRLSGFVRNAATLGTVTEDLEMSESNYSENE